MGRLLLVVRLAARDLRRRPGEAALLLLAIVSATATLTLGLILRGVTSDPYESTREATAGPDVVLGAGPTGEPGQPEAPPDVAGLEALTRETGVVDHSGPFPVAFADLEAKGHTGSVFAIGRDITPSPIDQPQLTEGSWVADGAVVVEAALADGLGVGEGDQIAVNGRSFRVAGVAVSAATPPYPEIYCFVLACWERTGVVWLTSADALSLPPPLTADPGGTRERLLGYVLYATLTDPAAAPAFVAEHTGEPPAAMWGMAWQDIRDQTSEVVRNQREILVIGSRLIGLLAVASVAVLVGGRMADQSRRVGLLKAVGGTPGLAAAVLLAEYLAVALCGAGAGLALGWVSAPLLTDPSVGLVGRAGTPGLSVVTAAQVTVIALGVAVAATLVPAVRASRTSTVLALADAARGPRRTAWLIAASARLPVPLLFGLRVAARRPRRFLLSTASVFVTVSGIVAALAGHADPDIDRLGELGLPASRAAQVDQALLMITITLVALAAINAIFVTSATVIDNRHSSALARALGATPGAVSAGLSAAQLLPALAGAVLGIPGGIGLFAAVSDGPAKVPLWQLLAVVPVTLVVVAALTTIPARLGARRSVAETLQAELA